MTDDHVDALAPEETEAEKRQLPCTEPQPKPNGHDRKAEIVAELAAMDQVDAGKIIAARAAELGVKPKDLDAVVRTARKARKDAERDAKAKAETKADAKPRLTGAARKAEIERLADLKEDDPLEYDEQREAAANSIGCRVGTLDDAVDKIIGDREAQRRLNNPPPPSGPHVDTPEVTELIADFNAKYFVLNEAGKVVVYEPKHDRQLHRDYFDRIAFDDFQKLYLNRFVKTGVSENTGEPIYSGVANVWLRHRDRKQYIGGMTFDPSDHPQPDDVLNLWQGFGVTARPGSCERFKDHLLNVICSGDATYYDYVRDWMADVVQRPDKRGEIALVLCGKEGCGKGTVGYAMKRLLGQHGLAIANAKHLVGHFNAHLRDCVLLFADEAFYAGDRAHISILKALITESDMMVEPKFQNAVQSKNFLHIIMASNEGWVVPASLQSRRFFVLAVPDICIGNFAYFAAIERELENGGYEALLAELLERDLSQVNLRNIPVTDALIDQRKLSLGKTEAWWLDCLSRGYVFRSEIGLEENFHVWLDPISTELLYQSYEKYCRSHGERHPLSRELLGRWMQATAGCRPVRQVRGMVGEHLVESTVTGSNYKSRVAEPVWQDRPHGYRLGALDATRKAFLKTTLLTVEWPKGPDEGSPDDVL